MFENYKGGIGRKEFTIGMLCYFGVLFIATFFLSFIVSSLWMTFFVIFPFIFLIYLFFVAIIWFSFIQPLIIRRLYDIGLSVRYYWLYFLVLIMTIILFICESYLIGWSLFVICGGLMVVLFFIKGKNENNHQVISSLNTDVSSKGINSQENRRANKKLLISLSIGIFVLVALLLFIKKDIIFSHNSNSAGNYHQEENIQNQESNYQKQIQSDGELSLKQLIGKVDESAYSSWKTYSDKGGRFEFKYPSDWVVDDRYGVFKLLSPKWQKAIEDGKNSEYYRYYSENTCGYCYDILISLRAIDETLDEYIIKNQGGYEVISKNIQFGGETGYEVVEMGYSTTYGILIKKDGYLYEIQLTESRPDQLTEIENQILYSFKIIENKLKISFVSFEENNNSKRGDSTSSKYWDRKIVAADKDGGKSVLVESIVDSFGLELRGNPVIYTFVPEKQTAYFYTTVDGTEITSNCYSLSLNNLKINKLNYNCFNEYYTANRVISPDGIKTAYFSYDSIYIIDITNGQKIDLVKAGEGEVFNRAGNEPDFKWVDNNTLQYPVYDENLKLINIKNIHI